VNGRTEENNKNTYGNKVMLLHPMHNARFTSEDVLNVSQEWNGWLAS